MLLAWRGPKGFNKNIVLEPWSVSSFTSSVSGFKVMADWCLSLYLYVSIYLRYKSGRQTVSRQPREKYFIRALSDFSENFDFGGKRAKHQRQNILLALKTELSRQLQYGLPWKLLYSKPWIAGGKPQSTAWHRNLGKLGEKILLPVIRVQQVSKRCLHTDTQADVIEKKTQ